MRQATKPMIIGISSPTNIVTKRIEGAVLAGPPRHDVLVMQHYTARLDVTVCDVRTEAEPGAGSFHLVHESEEVVAAPDVADWIVRRYPSG
ncbi:hypothetical protein [Cryptosporangium arvum]|uniref:Uncharacterized protein n=1 Tax=Cryptosporangium arvum DSM 44712 TaxID=927661 RepID=A0A010ZSW3_9ACTN|nr:hypothetical protein [Cryptosporangium arvum]EXG81764.1 hypothetical protein CryarDRAFT_2884 [Cryptosporangium arvum DSM 44712]